jgi:hypothetical protein
MHNRIDIDPKHSRAIVQETGERLRAVRELEEQSPSIVPAAERWDKRRR